MHGYRDIRDKDYETWLSKINFEQLITDYSHLLLRHNNDLNFAKIVAKLGGCDIISCKMFTRNNRNRAEETKSDELIKKEDEIYFQILDKMHCCFYHCYDIGYRLTPNEQEIICKLHDKSDEKMTMNNGAEQYLIDELLLKRNQIIHAKRQKIFQIAAVKQKYNQLTMVSDHEKQHGEFCFGFKFNYLDKDYEDTKDEISGKPIKNIGPMYAHMKDELTNTGLGMQQFDNEYQKSKIHYESQHCKSHFRPFMYDTYIVNARYTERIITLEHILCVMVYCNYDSFQNKFSKTYRENDVRYHKNYYWIGQRLKQAVHVFGTEIQKSSVHSFYHGINKQLLFQQYIAQTDHDISRVGLSVQCPLSTSSASEVATNFATLYSDTSGLIVEFGGKSEKCFSCDWLSDFGNEREYLFVQMKSASSSGVFIKNMTNAADGYHYETVLSAFQYFTNLSQLLKTKEYDNSSDSLLKMMILNQISLDTASIFSKFAQKMLYVYFDNFQHISVHYNIWKNMMPSTTSAVSYSDCDCIDITLLNRLLPKSTEIHLFQIELTDVLLKNIFSYFKQKQKTPMVNVLTLYPKNNSMLTMHDAVNKYAVLFDSLENVFLSSYYDHIIIQRCSQIEFICQIVDEIGNIHIGNANKSTEYLDKLIEFELLKNKSNATDIDTMDICQRLFHQQCGKKRSLSIQQDRMKLKEGSYLFNLLCHKSCQWINLRKITQLFSNLKSITVDCGDMSQTILEQLLSNIISIQSDKTMRIPEIKWEQLKMQLEQIVDVYAPKLEIYGVFISCDIHSDSINSLYVNQLSKLDFAIHYLNKFGETYFGKGIGKSSTIIHMNKLIDNELLEETKANMEYDTGDDQFKFHKYCLEKNQISLCLTAILLNKQSYPTQLYCENYDWIKLSSVNKLFPNLKNIYNKDIALSVMDDIFNYLQTADTQLTEIHFENVNDNGETLIQRYVDKFREINYDIDVQDEDNRVKIVKIRSDDEIELEKLKSKLLENMLVYGTPVSSALGLGIMPRGLPARRIVIDTDPMNMLQDRRVMDHLLRIATGETID
eukprot:333488_1